MSQDIRFKIARQVAGLTQLQLAKAVGVREHQITRLETGRAQTDRATAERIAAVLGKRPYELGI